MKLVGTRKLHRGKTYILQHEGKTYEADVHEGDEHPAFYFYRIDGDDEHFDDEPINHETLLRKHEAD